MTEHEIDFETWINKKLKVESDQCMDRFYPLIFFSISGFVPNKDPAIPLKDWTIRDAYEQEMKDRRENPDKYKCSYNIGDRMDNKIGTHQFGKTHCEICPMQDLLSYRKEIGAYCKQFREYLYKDGPKILRGPTCLRDEIVVRDFLMPELKGRYYEPPAEDTSRRDT